MALEKRQQEVQAIRRQQEEERKLLPHNSDVIHTGKEREWDDRDRYPENLKLHNI